MGATVKVIHTSIITEWTIKKTRNIKRTVCVCVCGSSVFCLLPCFVSNNDPVGHVKYAWQHWPTWMLSYHFHVLSFWYLCVCLGMCIRGYVRPWTRKIRPFELCDMKIFYAWRWLICVSSDHYLSIFRCFFFLYLLACVSALPEFKLWNGHVWSATPKETKNRNEGNVSIAYCSNHILDSIKLNVARVREHKKKIPTCSIKLLQPDATH